MNISALPPSLGLRPQAMVVSLVTDELKGCFLHQTVKARTLLEQAAQLTVFDSEDIKAEFYHRAFIGAWGAVRCLRRVLRDLAVNRASVGGPPRQVVLVAASQ